MAADSSNLESIKTFKRKLEELEGDTPTINRLFYLSIIPQIYESTITNLGDSRLSDEHNGWRRVVIEG